MITPFNSYRLVFSLAIAIGSLLWVHSTAVADSNVPRFGLFEISFRCPDMTGNPFDPAANDVWAEATGPKDRQKVPAFYDGDGVWKARVAPTTVGQYRISLSRNGVDETANATGPVRFNCIDSSSPGFIRTTSSGASWPHFVFDSGAIYFPIGMDAAWGGQDVLPYDQLFPKMTTYHMNFARVWMTFWDGKALDWSPDSVSSPAPGTYLLDAAKKVDTVLLSAENTGVYVQLTLQHHGQVTKVVDANWNDSPLNAKNPNGFLAEPNDFFTDPRAIALTKAKFRYIVARYSWCSHLLGWELFNEIQNDPEDKEPDVAAWHRTMEDYIRSIDPYHHLITTSYTDPSQQLAKDTDLDYYQAHTYPQDPSEFFRSQAGMKSSVPIFWGEFGSSGTQTREILHNGVWAGLMDSCAGAPQFWYWDIVQHNNWWQEFASVSNYISLSGLLKASASEPVPATVSTATHGPLNMVPALGWENERGDGIVTVTQAGVASGMQGIPASVQGQYHHDMFPNPITINTNFDKSVTMHVMVATISAAGAHIQIDVDGQKSLDVDLAGTGADRQVTEDHTLTITSGQHSTVILNTGSDWFNLNRIVIDDVAPGAQVMVRNIGSRDLFWVNRAASGDGPPMDVSMNVPVQSKGAYDVYLYDTTAGSLIGGPVKANTETSTLVFPIVMAGHDIGGWIAPAQR